MAFASPQDTTSRSYKPLWLVGRAGTTPYGRRPRRRGEDARSARACERKPAKHLAHGSTSPMPWPSEELQGGAPRSGSLILPQVGAPRRGPREPKQRSCAEPLAPKKMSIPERRASPPLQIPGVRGRTRHAEPRRGKPLEAMPPPSRRAEATLAPICLEARVPVWQLQGFDGGSDLMPPTEGLTSIGRQANGPGTERPLWHARASAGARVHPASSQKRLIGMRAPHGRVARLSCFGDGNKSRNATSPPICTRALRLRSSHLAKAGSNAAPLPS